MDEQMSREKAFEIMNLDPSTSTDKIKAKYENFMRRAKFDDSVDEVLITRAYDAIMGFQFGNIEPDPVYTEKGLNKKKIENFFYHNKRGLIYGSVAAIVLITILVLIFAGKIRYGYTISVLGQVTIGDQELMANYYEELLEEEHVLVDYYIVGNSVDGDLSEQFINKLMGDLQGGESDLFIIVPEYAKFLSYDGALTDLTPYLADLGIAPDDENILFWYNEDGDQIAAGYRYGNKSIFNEGMNGLVPEYIAIPYQAEYTEHTKTVILDLISQNN
jgi:hypothetical protein